MAQRKVYWRADIPRQLTIVRSRCGLVSCYPAHRNCSGRQLALIGEYQHARQECKDGQPLDEMFSHILNLKDMDMSLKFDGHLNLIFQNTCVGEF